MLQFYILAILHIAKIDRFSVENKSARFLQIDKIDRKAESVFVYKLYFLLQK
jgi:hypothetical protein